MYIYILQRVPNSASPPSNLIDFIHKRHIRKLTPVVPPFKLFTIYKTFLVPNLLFNYQVLFSFWLLLIYNQIFFLDFRFCFQFFVLSFLVFRFQPKVFRFMFLVSSFHFFDFRSQFLVFIFSFRFKILFFCSKSQV